MTHNDLSHGRALATANNGAGDAAGFDLFKLDCAADALRSGPPLTREEQHELRRVIENLTPLLETMQ